MLMVTLVIILAPWLAVAAGATSCIVLPTAGSARVRLDGISHLWRRKMLRIDILCDYDMPGLET
jgi:hypothetical protein